MSRVRKRLGTGALLIASIVFSLVLCETIARHFLHPIDYMRPPLVDDEILGHKIEPGASWHDEWGFRNRHVPQTSDVVAIGDSQTYGIGAASTDAWPAAFARISGRDTYNLSLGGYGPVQYLYLLEEKALALKPSLVIVGLYYGNDFNEAFAAAYHIDHWKALRTPEMSAWLDSLRAAVARRPRPAQRSGLSRDGVRALLSVREWFARHSVVYRALVEASPIGRLLRISQTRLAPEGELTILDDRAGGIHTAFDLSHRLHAVDLSDVRVREGLRISREVFLRMRDVAAAHGVELLVALIPTKPGVYARHLEADPSLEHQDDIAALLASERRIDTMMKAFFDEAGIRYVDTLPALQDAVGEASPYPANANSHPNKHGYAAIARAIQRHLESN